MQNLFQEYYSHDFTSKGLLSFQSSLQAKQKGQAFRLALLEELFSIFNLSDSVQLHGVANHIGFFRRPAAGDAGILGGFLNAVAHFGFITRRTAVVAQAVNVLGRTKMAAILRYNAAFFTFEHFFHGAYPFQPRSGFSLRSLLYYHI
jgi:hypothetical protein